MFLQPTIRPFFKPHTVKDDNLEPHSIELDTKIS